MSNSEKLTIENVGGWLKLLCFEAMTFRCLWDKKVGPDQKRCQEQCTTCRSYDETAPGPQDKSRVRGEDSSLRARERGQVASEAMTNFSLVKNFHLVFNRPMKSKPTLLPQSAADLRCDLIAEELEELVEAFDKSDIIRIADALADLLYVIYGTAVEMGIEIDDVFREVHRSNMTKLDQDGKPILREDGKVLKSENYEPPDIAGALNYHRVRYG